MVQEGNLIVNAFFEIAFQVKTLLHLYLRYMKAFMSAPEELSSKEGSNI
jgi:hypothetical protein